MKSRYLPGLVLLFVSRGLVAQVEDVQRMRQTALPIPAALAPGPQEAIKCGLPIISRAIAAAAAHPRTRTETLARLLERPAMQTSILKGKFRVHFDTTGYNMPALLDPAGNRIAGTAFAFVDSIFAILDHVIPVEVGQLHYPEPISDDTLGGGPECDIYVMELGNEYGYTTPDASVPEGGRVSSYVTIDNDFVFVRPDKNRGIPGLRVTLAHELHHVIQLGNYGYWDNDLFLYEITSTWMEDVVYPEVNDYYNYLTATWGHFRNPETSFTSSDMIMYSRAIWGHYIAKRYGIDVMRETWEQVRAYRPQQAIDQALKNHGVTFADAYAEWSVWNYFTGSRANPATYYTDGADYPLILQAPVDFTGSLRDVSGSLDSFGTHYCQVERTTDTMTVMIANVDFASTLLTPIPSLPYTLRLRSGQPDPSFKPTPDGLYAKLDVDNAGLWSTWYLVGDSVRPYVDPSSFSSDRPFPCPFHPSGGSLVYVPVAATGPTQGGFYIFTSSGDLVRRIPDASSMTHLSRQMFAWDGRTDNGSLAPTGVYVFVLDLSGQRITGKIPVIRE